MATYTKPLKTMQIMLNGVGETFTIEDTADKPIASQALAQFLAEKTMVIPQEDAVTYIPFHAVVVVAVAVMPSEEMSRDPYGCEDESDGGSDDGGSDDGGSEDNPST